MPTCSRCGSTEIISFKNVLRCGVCDSSEIKESADEIDNRNSVPKMRRYILLLVPIIILSLIYYAVNIFSNKSGEYVGVSMDGGGAL